MNRSKKRIVALVPAYNAGEFLLDSVESLVRQTRVPDLILVIDDCSSDDSIESIRHLEQRGDIEIFRNPENMGKAESLNLQFDRNDCDYFLIQDADDISLPTRVEKQVAFMEADPKLGCSSAFIHYINKDGENIGRGQLDLLTQQKLQGYLESDEPFGLFCPAAVIKAEAVADTNLRFRKRFWPADDIDLWNRIAEAGWKVLAQPEALVGYRIHGASAVTSSFYRTRMQFEWVRASLRARRKGLAEPTLEEFVTDWDGVGSIGKLNRWRKMTAKAHYRNAGFQVAERKFLFAALSLGICSILQPSYLFNRLLKQKAGTTS